MDDWIDWDQVFEPASINEAAKFVVGMMTTNHNYGPERMSQFLVAQLEESEHPVELMASAMIFAIGMLQPALHNQALVRGETMEHALRVLGAGVAYVESEMGEGKSTRQIIEESKANHREVYERLNRAAAETDDPK